jgi:CS domain
MDQVLLLTIVLLVLWAQRSSSSDAAKNIIYLTIATPDVPTNSLALELTPTRLTFTGYSETKKITYHVQLEFYGEIDVEHSKTNHTPRDVELVLRKKELAADYWPRLLKDSKKVHFLKTDFDKVSLFDYDSFHISMITLLTNVLYFFF